MTNDLKHKTVAASPIVMTTETQDGLADAERITVLSAQCAFGARVFNDVFASVHDVAEGRAKVVEQTMQDGVKVVMDELKQQAIDLHADAVVAITIQYTPIGYGSSNMTLVSGIGTAVRLID
jgi:uncharacterized protein YbjQ (UPF0145 family)